MACQLVWGYFKPRDLGIMYILHILCGLRNFYTWLYQIFLSNMNNFQTDLLDP